MLIRLILRLKMGTVSNLWSLVNHSLISKTIQNIVGQILIIQVIGEEENEHAVLVRRRIGALIHVAGEKFVYMWICTNCVYSLFHYFELSWFRPKSYKIGTTCYFHTNVYAGASFLSIERYRKYEASSRIPMPTELSDPQKQYIDIIIIIFEI